LRGWLWPRPVLRLGWTVLLLLRAGLWLNGSWLRRTNLRLLRLDRSSFGLHRPDLRLNGSVLRLYWSGLRLTGADLRLTRPYLRLAGTGWLNLRPIIGLARPCLRLTGAVDLAWSGTGLARTNFGLAGTVRYRSGVGASNAGLRGDRPGSGDHCRTALVDVVELLTVLCGFALVLELGGHGWNAWPAHGCDLCRLWPNGDATSAAVVGDAIVVIDDDSAVVDVGDVDVDAVDGTVVVEVVAVPVAAVITDAGVAEAVVDATVEANVQTPEAAMKAVAVVVGAPIAGGPEGAVVGWSAPCAGDPVIACGSPTPVAGSPDVVGRGGDGLFIIGKRRRRLVGVFDGRSLALFVELVVRLSILISLVLIGGRGRTGLLRSRFLWGRLGSVLLGVLLGLGLRADSEDTPLSGWRWVSSRLRLAIVYRRHVGVGRVGSGVVGDLCCVGVYSMTAYCAD
jgi:hypothetical protein